MPGTRSLAVTARAPTTASRDIFRGLLPVGVRGCGVGSRHSTFICEGSDLTSSTETSTRDAGGTQGSPGTSSFGEETCGGTLVSKDPRQQGNVSLEGLPHCNNNFMVPGSGFSRSPFQPVGCRWSDGGGSRWAWPGVWTWGLPGGARGRGSGASAEGARNAEALLRPLGGGGCGAQRRAGPPGPDRSQRGALRPGSVSGQGRCMWGWGNQAPNVLHPQIMPPTLLRG